LSQTPLRPSTLCALLNITYLQRVAQFLSSSQAACIVMREVT